MFFPSTVTLNPATGKNEYGDVVYGTPLYPKCRWEKIEKIVTGPGNKQFLTCAWVQLEPGTVVNREDQIILPDNTTSPIVSIIHVKTPSDYELCVEVWLGEEVKGGM